MRRHLKEGEQYKVGDLLILENNVNGYNDDIIPCDAGGDMLIGDRALVVEVHDGSMMVHLLRPDAQDGYWGSGEDEKDRADHYWAFLEPEELTDREKEIVVRQHLKMAAGEYGE